MGDANDLTISSIPSNDNLHPLQSHARKVIAATEVISSYCASEGLPHPSFDCHAPTVTIPSTAPLAVQNARQTVINSATVIQRLVTEPAEYLPNLAIHVRSAYCQYTSTPTAPLPHCKVMRLFARVDTYVHAASPSTDIL